jgi:Phasin protein
MAKDKKTAKMAKPAAASKPAAAAAKATKTAKTAAKGAADQLRAAGENAREMASKAASNAGKINMAVIDQAEANTKAAFAAMRAAASAGTLTGIAKVQSDYVKAQGKRSVDQAREIGDLIAQFGRDAMQVMRGK